MAENLDAVLNIAHLNIRKEKAGEDEGPVAVDVKLAGELGIDALKGLFGTKASFERVTGNLYTKDGDLASVDLEEIKLTCELSTLQVKLAVPEGHDVEAFESAELNKVRIKPLAGRVCEVTARLQLHPSDEQITWLASHLGFDLRVTASKRQGELDLQKKPVASAGVEAAVH